MQCVLLTVILVSYLVTEASPAYSDMATTTVELGIKTDGRRDIIKLIFQQQIGRQIL